MSIRRKSAIILVAFGCLLLLAGAALHLGGAYPQVSRGIAGSNLSAGLQSALRAVFLLMGWDWIVFAIVVLIAAFTETRLRKPLVLFCGAALLVQTAVMLRFVGWFAGTDVIGAAGLLIFSSGLVFAWPVPRSS